MRHIKIYLLLMIAFAFGCDKDDTLRNTETEVGHSRVTFFSLAGIER